MSQIASLLLPLKDQPLLLPANAVADVIPFSDLLTTAASVKWILGKVSWRGQSVPVISIERLNQQANPAPNPKACFAILPSLCQDPKLPYFGIFCQDQPQAIAIQEKNTQQLETTPQGRYDACTLLIGTDQAAIIPALDAIEQVLLTVI